MTAISTVCGHPDCSKPSTHKIPDMDTVVCAYHAMRARAKGLQTKCLHVETDSEGNCFQCGEEVK